MLPSDLDERFPPKRRQLPPGCCRNRDGECPEADACNAYWRNSLDDDAETHMNDTVDVARAAIAKATGDQS